MKSFGTIGSFVFAALLSMVFTPAIASDIKMVDFSIDSSKVIACPYKPHHPLTLNIRNGKFAFTYKDDQFYVLVLDICGKILYKKQSYNAAECKLSNDCSLLYVNHFIGEERWSPDVHDIKTGKIYYPFGEGNSFRPLSSGKYYYKGRHPTVIRDLNGVEVGNIYKTYGCKDIKEIDDSLLLSVDGNFLSLYELPEFKLLYAREFYLFHNFSFNRYRIKSGFSLDGRYCTIFGEGHAEVYDISDDKFCELPDFPRSGIRQYSLLFIKSQGNKIFYLSHN
jgi:hypothetical protein